MPIEIKECQCYSDFDCPRDDGAESCQPRLHSLDARKDATTKRLPGRVRNAMRSARGRPGRKVHIQELSRLNPLPS